ncbi:sensor histidine kinase [Leucobacter luti]|uniref:sensor histidine kinase n=1 Tax=Leucobacter luti TaxID=340320 RepID=UPI001C68EF69|nr:sensor histidine kinase [Leucobacter luti]QYM74739.1 sensor histidine kinase [Leucobacter luti]
MSKPAQPAKSPLRWWDLGVGAVCIVMLIPGGVGVVSRRGDAANMQPFAALFPELGILAGFLVLYVVTIRPALRREHAGLPPAGRDWVALALLAIGLGAAVAMSPGFATLQAILYPMIWTITGGSGRPRAVPIGWSAALAAATGVGAYFAYARLGFSDAAWSAAMIAACSFGFAVFLGLWLTRVYSQSEQHRSLAERLRESQAEVAALSEASGAAAERERLSRELHDTLTQTLTGLVMLSEQAERALLAGDAERALERTVRVGATARDAVGEARALVATTQPLGEGELTPALERIAARLHADTGLEVECCFGPVHLDREQEVVLLRAAQEGLANARRHAHATRVVLVLDERESSNASLPPRVVLRVEDNGVGPAAGPGRASASGSASGTPGTPGAREAGAGGFGLTGLADRARALGGEINFGPREGGGACLEVSLTGRQSPAVPADQRVRPRRAASARLVTPGSEGV